jgi:DNA-binding protein HU-beta
MKCEEKTTEDFLAGFVDTLLEAMKNRESVIFENFGKFYIEDRRGSTVFKFNPSQKFKAILGWSNTYKGEI